MRVSDGTDYIKQYENLLVVFRAYLLMCRLMDKEMVFRLIIQLIFTNKKLNKKHNNKTKSSLPEMLLFQCWSVYHQLVVLKKQTTRDQHSNLQTQAKSKTCPFRDTCVVMVISKFMCDSGSGSDCVSVMSDLQLLCMMNMTEHARKAHSKNTQNSPKTTPIQSVPSGLSMLIWMYTVLYVSLSAGWDVCVCLYVRLYF